METNSEGTTGAQDLAALVGRVMMSALFLWGGFANLTAAERIDAYFSSLGLRFPDLVRLFAVAVELSGGLAVLFGFQARLAAAGLAVWCIVTALVGHTNFADADAQIQFMKNVAMSGGFIFIAAFGPGAYALALPLFREGAAATTSRSLRARWQISRDSCHCCQINKGRDASQREFVHRQSP